MKICNVYDPAIIRSPLNKIQIEKEVAVDKSVDAYKNRLTC